MNSNPYQLFIDLIKPRDNPLTKYKFYERISKRKLIKLLNRKYLLKESTENLRNNNSFDKIHSRVQLILNKDIPNVYNSEYVNKLKTKITESTQFDLTYGEVYQLKDYLFELSDVSDEYVIPVQYTNRNIYYGDFFEIRKHLFKDENRRYGILQNETNNINENVGIGFGRVFPVNNLGYCILSRKTRKYLFEDLVEIDIVNCHPTIMYEICKLFKLHDSTRFVNLKFYIENRDETIKILIQYYSRLKSFYTKKNRQSNNNGSKTINRDTINRDTIKELLITIMYTQNLTGWVQKYIGSNITKVPNHPIVDGLIKEFDELKQNYIFNFTQGYWQYISEIRPDCYNIMNSILAYVLQNIESNILNLMFNYLVQNGYIEYIGSTTNLISEDNIYYCSLCHDGMLLPTKYIENKNTGKLCENLSKYIKQQIGFDIKFSMKKPSLNISNVDISELHAQNNTLLNNSNKLEQLENHFCKI